MLKWHNCKTDPPKKSGYYLLCDICNNTKHIDYLYYSIKEKYWCNDEGFIANSPYKWAEVELPE